MSKPENNSGLRILKTAITKSITDRSTLTYQIGCLPDNSLHLRISNNSSTGQFSSEWVKVEDIQKALAKGHKGSPLTSFLLQPLFKGKSVNTPAFVMSALTNERLLRVLKGKKRGHEFLDPEGFDARMQKLVTAKAKTGGATKGTTKKAVTRKAPRKKAAIKKRAVAKRKTAKTH